MKKNNIVGILCGIIISAFTVYIALDTFVIKDVYQTDINYNSSSAFAEAKNKLSDNTDVQAEISTENISENSIENSNINSKSSSKYSRSKSSENQSESSTQNNSVNSSQNIISSNSESEYKDYEDENVRISLKEYTVNNTQVYVADVKISSAEYIKTAFAQNTFGKNVTEKTSTIATENNAILAINGDYYGAQENSYVIRNGKVYRSTSNGDKDILCIYADGTMNIKNTAEFTADELVKQGVWQAFSFGPALVQNGNVTVSEGEEVGHAMASNPRTAIGILNTNHFLFVVSDGRTSESEGLSLNELAQFMQSIGVECAYNLDGGGSSTMYYQGNIVNNPTTNGKSIKEREVSDIVYIG